MKTYCYDTELIEMWKKFQIDYAEDNEATSNKMMESLESRFEQCIPIGIKVLPDVIEVTFDGDIVELLKDAPRIDLDTEDYDSYTYATGKSWDDEV